MNVCWLTYHDNVPAKGFWDQGWLIHELAAHPEHFSLDTIPAGEGALVLLPAKAHEQDIERLNADLARLPWVLLFLGEDECGDFNTDLLTHPNMRVWVQTPWPDRYQRVDRAIPVLWRVECPGEMAKHRPAKDLDWAFTGQITHERRKSCATVLRNLPGGYLVETRVFGARPDEGGLDYPTYCQLMSRARVVPCPSGAVNPDSFRAWEALQAGAIPVVDGCSPRPDFPLGYWDRVAPGHPFPVVYDWAAFPDCMADLLENWATHAARVGAWWLAYQRDLRIALAETVAALGGPGIERQGITVLIPTSPIPDHPSVAHLLETLNSVRQYPELANAEIIISCDGVRPEQEHLRARYQEYVLDLLWHARNVWRNVLVVVHEEHLHQVEMARRALELVRTEAILYVEHDAPLVDPIPWAGMLAALQQFDVVRFYHETAIPHEHGYLHRGEVEHGGHRFERTVQWSQRPHLARTAFYRDLLAAHFSPDARTFIEDKMHSVAQSPRWEGRIGIYLPEGESIRRSRHTDARQGEAKFDDRLVY